MSPNEPSYRWLRQRDCVKLRKILAHIRDLEASRPDGTFGSFGIIPQGESAWRQGDWFALYAGQGPVRNAVIQPGGVIATVQQQEYTCGTAACFAGWDALLFAPAGTQIRGNLLILPGDKVISVAEWAEEDLGLNPQDAGALFAAYNTIDRIEALITMWCGKE